MQPTISNCDRQVTSVCAGNFMWQPPQTPCWMPTTTLSPLLLYKPFIPQARHFLHRRRQFRAAALQFGEFLLQIGLALIQFRDLIFSLFLRRVVLLGCAGNLPLRRLALFHQNNLLILDFDDGLLAQLDFMGERAILLVLARLQLLIGVSLDLRFLLLDIEFEPFAVGLDLFAAKFGGVQLRLRRRGLGAEGFTFRPDMFQLLFDAADLPVAFL